MTRTDVFKQVDLSSLRVSRMCAAHDDGQVKASHLSVKLRWNPAHLNDHSPPSPLPVSMDTSPEEPVVTGHWGMLGKDPVTPVLRLTSSKTPTTSTQTSELTRGHYEMTTIFDCTFVKLRHLLVSLCCQHWGIVIIFSMLVLNWANIIWEMNRGKRGFQSGGCSRTSTRTHASCWKLGLYGGLLKV